MEHSSNKKGTAEAAPTFKGSDFSCAFSRQVSILPTKAPRSSYQGGFSAAVRESINLLVRVFRYEIEAHPLAPIQVVTFAGTNRSRISPHGHHASLTSQFRRKVFRESIVNNPRLA